LSGRLEVLRCAEAGLAAGLLVQQLEGPYL